MDDHVEVSLLSLHLGFNQLYLVKSRLGPDTVFDRIIIIVHSCHHEFAEYGGLPIARILE